MNTFSRLSFLLLVSLISNFSFAQNTPLVPYRVGNLFGLSDVNGKMVLSPRYTHVEPIGVGVFKFISANSPKNALGSDQNLKAKTGIIVGTKELISNSSHNHFTYLEQGIIVGSENSYTSQNSNLYSLNGEKLLDENISNFKLIVSPTAKPRDCKIAILAKHNDRGVSIFIFDTKKQKLLAPLLDHVSNFKIEEESGSDHSFICSYLDKNNSFAKDVIYYDAASGEHLRMPYTVVHQSENAQDEEEVYLMADPNGMEVSGDDGGMESMPMQEAEPGYSDNNGKLPSYFERINDQTIHFGGKEVRIAANEKVYFTNTYRSSYQTIPLLFYNGNQYGLLLTDNLRSEELYDTLIYLHNQYQDYDNPAVFNFLAGKKDVNGKWRYGILQENGKPIIPLQYDQISVTFKELEYALEDDNKPGKFVLKDQNMYSVDANLCLQNYLNGIFIVKMNGKYGLLNAKNQVLLPIEQDQIWKNKVNFLSTYPIGDNLYCYQKDNKYAAFIIHSGKGIYKNTGAIFPKIPLFIYENYMDQNGLDIYSLADESSLRFCLASNRGITYYRSK
jgi:hypothetical protein